MRLAFFFQMDLQELARDEIRVRFRRILEHKMFHRVAERYDLRYFCVVKARLLGYRGIIIQNAVDFS